MSGELISSAMNGLLSLVLPSSRSRTRSELAATQLHVVDDLVPARQLVVGADLEPDKLFRRRQRARGGRDERRQAQDAAATIRPKTLAANRAGAARRTCRRQNSSRKSQVASLKSAWSRMPGRADNAVRDARRGWTRCRRRSSRSSARMIRQAPGTISLGQGVVHYGPPPGGARRGPRRAGSTRPARTNTATAPACRRWSRRSPASCGARTASTSRAAAAIMVTAGANMAFMHAVLAITAPGDEIILPVPFYFNHEMAIEMAGCRAVRVADRRRAISCGSTRIERRSPIARARSSRSRRTIRAARCFSEASLRDVNALCRDARPVPHLPTRPTSTSPTAARHVSPGSFPGAAGHTISMYSLSKAYGFAGWRIGYMVVPRGAGVGDDRRARTRS